MQVARHESNGSGTRRKRAGGYLPRRLEIELAFDALEVRDRRKAVSLAKEVEGSV